VVVLAFVITVFAAVGAGGSAKKHSAARTAAAAALTFTTTPLLASGVAPVTGGTVTASVTPDLTNVGDSASEIQVATAPIDASGNFALQPTLTSGAMASVISSAIAGNNGWVNLDLTEIGTNGAATIQSISRQYVDAFGNPIPLGDFQTALAEAAAGETPNTGIGHLVGAEGDSGSITVDPNVSAPIGAAPGHGACPLATVTLVNQVDQPTVVGEFHTPRDIVFGSDKTFFEYGKSADTTSSVGVSAQGTNWSASGTVEIGNGYSSAVRYPQQSNLGYQVVTGFFYKEYHYVYNNSTFCASNHYKTKAYSWSQSPGAPLGPGADIHDVDNACLTRPAGQRIDLVKGQQWQRSANSFIKFGAAFNVFGFSGATQSGASSWVQIQYVAGTNNTNHYLCGNGNAPKYSTRVFAGG
jgi:hypothetical protein